MIGREKRWKRSAPLNPRQTDAVHGPESASLGFVNRVYTDLSKQAAHDH